MIVGAGRLDRRTFVTITGSALSSVFLAACDSRGPKSAERLLRYAERKNEALERALFRHTAMDAPAAGARLAGSALPSYFISKTVPMWNEAQRGVWTLEIGGMVDKPMKLTLQNLVDLPRTHARVNHYCVEGWTAVEQWTGVRLADLARIAGVQKGAEYVDFDSFDETTRESLTRWIRRESADEAEYEAALADMKNGLGFSPLTGQIVAIGVYDVEREKGAVYFDHPEKNGTGECDSEGACKLEPMGERDMLQKFWEVAEKYDTFVSFNGRGFDAPFLMIRSAVHRVHPTKHLLANRYLFSQPAMAKHVDLMEELTFYGAMRKRGTLHLWCRAFGIESPKAGGVSGDDVKGLYEGKKFETIARYNAGDLIATSELFKRWNDTLRF